MSYEGDSGYESSNDSTDSLDDYVELDASSEELFHTTEQTDGKINPIEINAETNKEIIDNNDKVSADSVETSQKIRDEINEKSEYSSEVNDYIKSVEELEIYQRTGLKEEIIDGRICLVRNHIDLDYIDENTQYTNRRLMEMGRSPYDSKTGEKIELHHIGQDYNSPLAELTSYSEHGDGNHSILHTSESESWRKDAKMNHHYNDVQRPNHWKSRI
ncbi:MAG: HNH/ENDO VII family nuclease [Faecalibacterium sp.]|nr:HNH/ENDO VII family nuclease [Ruminococcus sp.]MCM1391354.1 HNH/ENDO VII family nuclease [Ruminococcus sp.]MCM1484913.1 HNH/ENDO VII family nuclease [Faecalibacterium sp.]